MIGRWRERLNSALPSAEEEAGPAAIENRAPMGRGRVAMFAAGVAWLAVGGYLILSPYSPLQGIGAETTAVAQTTPSIKEVESYIPVPETAEVPPPSIVELARIGGESWIVSRVPTPEPANLPPPTIADLPKEQPRAVSAPPAAEPASATPAAEPAPTSTATAPAAPAEPAIDLKTLTGRELVKAPLATTLAPADVAVAERLRELLATRLERYVARKNERAAVEAFYRDRGFVPMWVEGGAETARASAVIAFLKRVHEDGLEPSDYPTPNFKAIAEADALADAELRLTSSVLDFARHAQTGRVHFTRVSGDILYHLEAPEAGAVLAGLVDARGVASSLAGYHPPHEGYKALKAKLAEARGAPAIEAPQVVHVPEGPTLRPGLKDPRVPALRKRLKAGGDPADTRYDDELVDAVKRFQTQAGLNPDGLVGVGTLRALNGNAPPRRTNVVDVILANMERWRWMPRDLGAAYSMLNIPDFTLKVVRNGAVVWRTKVVVGKPSTATPILSDSMKFITVNPTWNVPPSIVANEYLPALAQDSTVLERMGIKVAENPDGTVRMYMPPGDRNALGRLRFNFPNKFLVYQHDTSDKHLFKQERRAYSHGCMRVEDPVRYAEILLSVALPREGYTQERIRSMFGPSEIDIRFPRPVPVHITYQTAFVDDAGKLQIRDDLYGRDQALLAIMKGSERRVADIAIERRHQVIARDELRLPGSYRSSRYSGGNFFNWFLSR
jgi:murein L,D-transpeptidase YcbB/YkuD